MGEPTKIDDSPPDAQPSLSFDELVTLSATDELAPELAAKLDKILQTPTVYNYISAGNSHPKQPTDNKIGPILRVGFWNMERGLQFDLIKQALVEPGKFEETVDSGKKRTASQRARIVSWLDWMSAEHPAILRSGSSALHDFKFSCRDWLGKTAEVLSKLTRIAIGRTRIVPRGRFIQA